MPHLIFLFRLLLVAPVSFLCILLIGTLVRWDGQGAILTLPFVVAFWLGIPVSVLWATYALLLRQIADRRHRVAVVLLSVLNLLLWPAVKAIG